MTNKNKKPYLNSDLHFLVSCCKTDQSEDDIQYIHTYLSQITNHGSLSYEDIIHLAYQHGILPLVYKTIKKIVESSSLNAQHYTPNTQILTELKALYMSISHRNMLMSIELIRIMKLLEDHGIQALAFKGPTLAHMAYEDITLRQYVDLDVLVKKKDIYKIDALLKDRGYQRVLEITPNQEKVYMQCAHDLGLYHPKSGVHFEMHWSLMDDDYPIQVNLNEIWKNPKVLKINQQEIKTFPTEELLLYLCIHGSKHLWERIEWIKDIDFMLRTQDIDWEKVLKKAESSKCETMFYLGLSLSTTLFATPLTLSVQEEIKKHQELNIISDFVLESWQTPKSAFHKTVTILKLFPDLKKKLSYLNKILIKPSFNEYWYIDFPKGLYWLYYLLRPYLLIKKYFMK